MNVNDERHAKYSEAINDTVVDHPMWIGDEAEPLDYHPEREARIGDFVEEAAQVAMALASEEQAETRAEVARLTRLLEQRTAALTRTIDAKNAAEAKAARLETAINQLDEVAYSQIGLEEMLTVLPLGPNRAKVPGHRQKAADERAQPFRDHLRAALKGDQ